MCLFLFSALNPISKPSGLFAKSVPAKPEDFIGTWKLVASKNFNVYMKRTGTGFIHRWVSMLDRPLIDITVDGNEWLMDIRLLFKHVHCGFELNEQYVTRLNNKTVTTKFTFSDDGELIQSLKKRRLLDNNATITRYISADGQMVFKCQCEGVTAWRVYERVETMEPIKEDKKELIVEKKSIDSFV